MAQWSEPRIAYRHKSEHISKVYYSEVLKWAFEECECTLHRGSVALDIGCGGGFVVKLLEKLGFYAVGLDISKSLIRDTKGRALLLGDAVKIPVRSSSSDVITCFETIEHIAKPELVTSEICRVLRPYGVFILTMPLKNPTNSIIDFLRGEKTHASLMTLRGLLRMQKGFFRSMSYRCLYILPFPPTVFSRYFHFETKLFATHIWFCGVRG